MINQSEEKYGQSTKKKQKSKSKSKAKYELNPKSEPATHRTLLCEITRLKGQEKLLYVKQAKLKNIDPQQLFINYPSSQLEAFTFPIQVLQENGVVVKDEKGLHWTEKPSEVPHSDVHNEDALNGWTISLFDNSSIFQGRYENGSFHQVGYEINLNGNTYIGEFKNGNKSGKGTFYWFNSNEVYSGQWSGGLPHGHGKYLSHDFYEGGFSNGLKYGDGEEFFENGDKYIGQYINGVADGYGQYYWGDGSVYKGDFKHGVRHGYGIWTDRDNIEMYSGSYRMDKKEGFGMYEWIGKQMYKGHFKEDKRDGYGKLYRENRRSSSDHDHFKEGKVIYEGMWLKGKQKKDLPIDEEEVDKLEAFLSDSRVNGKKKERIGHKNCIPKN